MFAGTKRFRTLRLLGRGAMGFVYLVYDEELGCEVALKTLQSLGAEQIYDLKAEFRTLANVTHPNLVALYELFVLDDFSFFTMEFVDGVSFIEYVRSAPEADLSEGKSGTGGWIVERLGTATRQLVLGLSIVHAAGRVHRDIKPSNVLVDRQGRVVILDFGLARTWRAEEGTQSTDLWMVGTPAYMAPEQVWGSATPAADWYGVGTMLYEAVAGRRPYDGTPAAMLKEKGIRPPPSLRGSVPSAPALAQLIESMMLVDPTERPGPARILAELDVCIPPLPQDATETAAAIVSDTFVDRESESETLHQVFTGVKSGQPTMLLVEGPSGIGKSELLQRFVRGLARDHGAAILAGRCHPCESVAYKALDGAIDSLSRWLLGLSEARAALFAPRHLDALLRLFPVLGRVPVLATDGTRKERVDAQDLRRRGFGALREILVRIGDRVPLVLWLDDFQWSDVDSIQLLSALLTGPEPPRMLLVLSHRSEDRSEMPFLADIVEVGRSSGMAVSQLAVGPLDLAAAQGLAARLCASRMSSDEDLNAIAAESSGSPFFVGELSRAFVSSQSSRIPLAYDDTAPRLADVISGRAQQLSAQARKVLEIVCVAGHLLGRSVALNAAGVGEIGRPAIIALEQQRFVRTISLEDGPALEVYHDRIRETLVQELSSDNLVAAHRRIGEALQVSRAPDPARLFEHFRAAGDAALAARYAVDAAHTAAHALAFARAAELYREALALGSWDAPNTGALQTALADALVNAGRGSAAAPVYLSAAANADGPRSLELRRRAAEQWLVSGHIDEGADELRRLLKTLGIGYPRSAGTAALGLVGRVLQLRVRGTGFKARPESAIAPEKLLAIDTCNAAAKGLVQVDPIRGTYYSALALGLALEAGETRRVGRDLCLGGSALIVAGGSLAKWGAGMLELANRLGTETSDPYLLGSAAVTCGVVDILQGRWESVLDRCDEGVAILREQCRGVTWERAIGMMASIRALEELGRIPDALARMAEMRREAEEFGDIYAQVTARSYAAYWRLAADDPAGARLQVRDALALWTHRSYHLQHFYALRLESYVDVYEGDPSAAWVRLQTAWPEVQRSGLLRHPVVAADAALLRGRVALAAAVVSDRRRAGLLREVAKHARRLGRFTRPDTTAHALMLNAGTA
ncbi:MAG: AAA family ATPase, partial [Kofleriaceae bacterium]